MQSYHRLLLIFSTILLPHSFLRCFVAIVAAWSAPVGRTSRLTRSISTIVRFGMRAVTRLGLERAWIEFRYTYHLQREVDSVQGRYVAFHRFGGGLATIFPNTATVESELSPIGYAKNKYRTMLTDILLEGIFHYKQLDYIWSLSALLAQFAWYTTWFFPISSDSHPLRPIRYNLVPPIAYW